MDDLKTRHGDYNTTYPTTIAAILSSLTANHLSATRAHRTVWVLESKSESNVELNSILFPYARIVGRPPSVSEKSEYTGDRVIVSSLLTSRDTRRK